MNTTTPPGGDGCPESEPLRRLEAAIASATGTAPEPLAGAELIPVKTLAVLVERFEAAAATVADPVGTLRARINRVAAFLHRIADDPERHDAELLKILTEWRNTLAELVAVLDALIADQGRRQ